MLYLVRQIVSFYISSMKCSGKGRIKRHLFILDERKEKTVYSEFYMVVFISQKWIINKRNFEKIYCF